MSKALNDFVTASKKALDKATSAGVSFAASVRDGVENHGLVTFSNALLDSLRGPDFMGEKALRAIGTGPGSMFAKYTLAVRTLKECAPDGDALKISAKNGEATESSVGPAPVKTTPTNKGAASNTPASNTPASGADAGAGDAGGHVRIASMGESLANLVASAGDAAILEAFELLAKDHPSALSRLIGAGIAFAGHHAGINEAAAASVAGFRELLAVPKAA